MALQRTLQDAPQAIWSPQQVQSQRELAAALLQNDQPITNWAEGLNALAEGFIGGRKRRRADQDETAGRARRSEALAGLLSGSGMGSSAPAGFGMSSLGTSITSAPAEAASIPQGDRASYIRQGLVSRGLPGHVADGFLANFKDESGLDPGINERNPIVPGSRGGFGLYQLTGPRRRQYEAFAAQRGVAPSDVDAQLDFLMTELQGSERRAGQRILSAPDTASAAQAIVNDFLRPAASHRQSRAARYAGLPTQAAAIQAAYAPERASVSDTPSYTNAEAQAMAAQRDPLAVPYSGPGQTFGPGDMERMQNGTFGQLPAGTFGQGVQVASADGSGPSAETMDALMSGVNTSRASRGETPMPMPQAQAPTYQPAPYQPPQQQMAQMLMGQGSGSPDIGALLNDPWTAEIGEMLLGREMDRRASQESQMLEQQQLQEQRAYDAWLRGDERAYDRFTTLDDRAYTAGREDQRYAVDDRYRQDQLDVTRQGQTPSSVREYEYARSQGYQGSFADFEQAQRRAGAISVNLPGQPNIGTIPQGYAARQDEAGNWSMAPIPGGPEDRTVTDAAAAGSRQISTSIITSAANQARDAIEGAYIPTSGTLGQIASYFPETASADVRRRVDTLTANAKVENLQAMRNASPTGGALGAVSDSENAMLAAKSGTLDPSSPTFLADLDDYERTLLQIVHGYDEGNRIFDAEREAYRNRKAQPSAARATSAGVGSPEDPIQLDTVTVPTGIDPLDWQFMSPEERALFQ